MTPSSRRGRAAVAQRLTGVAFLAVIATLVGLTVALYQKSSTPVVHVTLEAGRAGNQLTKGADVKVRGLLAGEVRDVRSTGNGAKLALALDPDNGGFPPKTSPTSRCCCSPPRLAAPPLELA